MGRPVHLASTSRDLQDQVHYYATQAGISPVPSPGDNVADYLEAWIVMREMTVRPITWDQYRATVRRYLVPHIGHLRIEELTPAVLEGLFEQLLAGGGRGGRPLARPTVAGIRRTLFTALQDGIRHGYLFRNPVARTRVPSPEGAVRFRPRIWSARELGVFLDGIQSHPLAPLFTLAATTGLRRGELLGLTWGNIDLRRSRLSVLQQLVRDPGSGRTIRSPKSLGRSIALGERALVALRRQRRLQAEEELAAYRWHGHEHDLVFTSPEGLPLGPSYVSNHFHILVLGSGLPRIRLHDLRHTHASLLLLAGVPVHVVSQRLGHSETFTTLKVYAHVLPIMDHDAATRLEELVRDATPAPTTKQQPRSTVGGT